MNCFCKMALLLTVAFLSMDIVSSDEIQPIDDLNLMLESMSGAEQDESGCNLIDTMKEWLVKIGNVETLSNKDLIRTSDSPVKRKELRRMRQRLGTKINLRGTVAQRQAHNLIPNGKIKVVVNNGFRDAADYFIIAEPYGEEQNGSECGAGSFSKESAEMESDCPETVEGPLEGRGSAEIEYTGPSCGCVSIKGLVAFAMADDEENRVLLSPTSNGKRLVKKVCIEERAAPTRVRGGNKRRRKQNKRNRRQVRRALRRIRKGNKALFEEMVEKDFERATVLSNSGVQNEDEAVLKDAESGNKRRRNRVSLAKKGLRLRRRLTRGLNICCRKAIELDKSTLGNESECPRVPQEVIRVANSKNAVSEESCSQIYARCCQADRASSV